MAVIDSNHLQLAVAFFDDACALVQEYNQKDAARDAEALLKRSHDEGSAFCTKILPMLGKHLEQALELGTFNPVLGFAKDTGRTTPRFMGRLFKGVFDADGTILEKPDPQCIRIIRQVCYLFYKIEGEYDQSVVDECLNGFVETDRELFQLELDPETDCTLRIAQNLVGYIFRDFDPRDVSPRPGPGASASGTHRVYRFEPVTLYENLHQVYPYYDWFYTGRKHLFDRICTYRALPRKRCGTSLVRLVPKDSRGPRIICMEPQEYMWLQQGLGDAIRRHVERHPLTRGRVNFRDQRVNGKLAVASSLTREYATLDMKDASDRISRQLVATLFDRSPELKKSLLALSTGSVSLPDGRTLDVAKFAPMGSSLCFPVMSVVHYVLGLAALYSRFPHDTRRIARDGLYVYGDDIVVKTRYASRLMDEFPRFGLMFNRTKSFVHGHFRESCGHDAFMGECVTPYRYKKRFLHTLTTCQPRKFDPRDMHAAAEFAYNLQRGGYTKAATEIQRIVTSNLGWFPTTVKGSGILGWYSDSEFDSQKCERRWHKPSQNYRVKVAIMRTLPDSSMCGTWERLMRHLVQAPSDTARVDERGSKTIVKEKWVPVQTLSHVIAESFGFGP